MTLLFQTLYLELKRIWEYWVLKNWVTCMSHDNVYKLNVSILDAKNAIMWFCNLTMMDVKESKKRAPKVNAGQKTFLIDYLWANSKLVEKKNEQNDHALLSFMYSLAYLFLFLINFGRITTNIDNTHKYSLHQGML